MCPNVSINKKKNQSVVAHAKLMLHGSRTGGKKYTSGNPAIGVSL